MNVDKSGWMADADVDAVTPTSHQELHTLERTVQTVILFGPYICLGPKMSLLFIFSPPGLLVLYIVVCIHHLDNIVVIIIRIVLIFNLN